MTMDKLLATKHFAVTWSLGASSVMTVEAYMQLPVETIRATKARMMSRREMIAHLHRRRTS